MVPGVNRFVHAEKCIAALEALAQLILVALQHGEGVCESAVVVCLSQQCDNQGVC